jgi:hypothetical protein
MTPPPMWCSGFCNRLRAPHRVRPSVRVGVGPAACSGLDTTIKYLLQTTSGAAGNGLFTIKYLRCITSCVAGDGLRAAIKYQRRTARGAAGNGLGTAMKCPVRSSTCGAQ